MSVERTIEDKLRAALSPGHLEVINESHMHNVPPGSESHFKVVVVSPAFEGLGRVARHRKINAVLADELKGAVHALSMETHTAPEWDARGATVMESPPCHGGGTGGNKADS